MTVIVRQRLVGEQVVAQFLVEHLVAPADPFEQHGGVLFLLVGVVPEDAGQFRILAGIDAQELPKL